MNPSLKICAHESRVGGDTEVLFNDDFYEVSGSGICLCSSSSSYCHVLLLLHYYFFKRLEYPLTSVITI